MKAQCYYHFDRRFFLKKVIGGGKKLKNNRGLLNGFFMGLGLSPQAKKDFGEVLHQKIENFVFNEKLELDFIPELVSRFNSYGKDEIKKVIFELIFEKVRRVSFINSPSRLKSLFVVNNINDLEKWKKTFGTDGETYKLTADKINSILEVDSNWFESCMIENIKEIENLAENYWNGKKSSEEKNEWLITGEFTCEIISETESK